MSILTSRERPDNDPTALFETMIAYSGSCRIADGDKLIIKVDTAWHPAWIGTESVRFFKVDSGVLSITTAWQTHPLFPGRMARGVLTARECNVERPRHRHRFHGGEPNAAERPESAS